VAACSGGGSAGGPLDVLFITVDDLNDWIPPLGGYPGNMSAPNFERLAGRSTLFTNAHSQGVSCKASRASALTGLWPATVGITGTEASRGLRDALPNALTIPAHFKSAGYLALGYGKVLHRPDPPSWDGERFRFLDPAPSRSPLSGVHFPYFFDWGPIDLPASFMGDHRKVTAALEAMRKPRTQPLFLGIGLVKPHPPFIVPREFFDLYPEASVVLPVRPPGELDDLPEIAARVMGSGGYQRRLESRGVVRDVVRAYLASVSFADAMLGMILDELDRTRAWDHTVVVLWSDQGFHLGEKERWQKFTLWEETTRVPLFVAAPGVGRPGARCDRAVGLIDLFPTLVELCGLPAPQSLEGESLVPLLRDPRAPRERPALSRWNEHRAVRSDRWRYIRYADGSEELYDHESDPGEWTNRAADSSLATVKAELAAWLERFPRA